MNKLTPAIFIVLYGCGGAKFALPADWGQDAGADAEIGATGPEGGEEAGTDAAPAIPDAPDVSVVDASPIDAGPDVQALADANPPPSCGPVLIQPHDVCPLEPVTGVFPLSYARMASPPPAGCPSINAYLPTPQACQCSQTFNCSCLKAEGVSWTNCEDYKEAPWVY